jgi:predicted nucleotidyltransferase
MINILRTLQNETLISPPDWLLERTKFLCLTGSHAYGISNPESDYDVYGFCIPPLEYILPHTAGHIEGFGRQVNKFDQFQQEGVEHDGKVYDISIYNVAKFVHLCMENNPNMIDCLFTPRDCILLETPESDVVLNKRWEFLHKGCYYKFLGYAMSQMKKIESKNPEGKRKIIVDTFGFDTKYASHLYRLANECEQILTTEDLNLRQASSQMRLIRNGRVSLFDLREWFQEKQIELKRIYEESALRYGPDENKIKSLLVKCLTLFYGDLSKFTFGSNK